MVTGASLVSLLENNQHIEAIHIYYLDYLISEDNKQNLKQIADKYENCSFTLIDARKYHEVLKGIGVKSWRGIYVTWLKLLALSDLRLDSDRILFVNGQTIVNGVLDELIALDFDGNIMALSYDCLLNDHKATIGLKGDDGYYNCGIMLINHEKWLEENIGQQVKQWLLEKNDYVIVDQDFCNVVFKGKIKTLDSTYNFSSAYYGYDLKRLLRINKLQSDYFYSYEELMTNYYSPKIIHSLFGITGKPWEENNKHPQRFLWDKYIAMTPWQGVVRPVAKYNINWFLYDILPSWLFMAVYRAGVKSKYGKERRNRLVLMLFDKFTPQKGT